MKKLVIEYIKKQILNEQGGLALVSAIANSGDGEGGSGSAQGPGYSPVDYKQDPEFSKELNRVCEKFNIDPKDLLGIMNSESHLNPAAQNPGSNATGLIQFMPNVAKNLGTSVEELKMMTRAQQMLYVEKFFERVGLPKGASGGMIYGHVFLPGRAKKGNVLTTKGENFYNSNAKSDLDGDGQITMDPDLTNKVKQMRSALGLGENKKIIIKFGEILEESKKKRKEDRCTRIAKSKYDAWPSAYASGAVVKCRQGKIWKNIKEEEELEETKKPSKAKHLAKKGVALAAAASTMLGAKDQEKLQKSKKAKTEKHVVAEEELDEKWSEKYKKSIDCKNPKGFSQRAHCQGRKKNEEIELDERKLGKPSSETNLGDWFKRKGAPGKKGGWVDCNTCHDGKCKPCGRQEGEKRSKYPRCRPTPSQCKGYKRRSNNLQKEVEEIGPSQPTRKQWLKNIGRNNIEESQLVNTLSQLLGFGGVALAAGAAEAAFRAHRMKKRTPKFAQSQKKYFHQILIGLMKSEEAMKEYNNKSFVRATDALVNANIIEKEYSGQIRFYMKDLYARIGKVYKHGDGLKFERHVDKEDLYNLNIPAFEEKYGKFFNAG